MRFVFVLLTLFMSLVAQAAPGCKINDYLKSTEGQEKISNLVERSKGLILSKLEELSIEEKQVQIQAVYPKSAENFKSSISIKINAKNMHAEGASFTLSKVTRDDDCGLEISISGGQLLDTESGKKFGSLGRVKEFVRLN
jgi:hypothetical protein